MPTIDFHNHFYPPEYLNALRDGPSNVRITTDNQGNPCLHYPGDYNVAVRGHRDINYRLDVLAEAGIDTQILTLTTPGTHIEEPKRAIELARLVNDAFAAIVRNHGERFRALATLPLNDPVASLRELKRTMDQVHFAGAMLFSNVNGSSLADERFWPLYEFASDRRAVLHIHPTNPTGVEAMKEYWLMPLVGFPLDTTLAAAHLVFAGVAKRFPGIRWALSHLGGAIPYIAERLDRGFEAFADCRRHIDRPPSDYLREFYYDTVNFDTRALRLAIDFAGVDHILAGSDYPHLIGSLEKMLASIQALELTTEDKAKLLGQNAKEVSSGGAR
jgi:aminocarboxymuconate-semialdehyde decarboxylase